MRALDLKTLKVTGPEQMLVNGGTDISKKPVWIEAPHLLKKDGHYYLIAAEGGTAEDHSEVVFKSDKIDGPYIPYEHNPILTQRNLDPARLFPVTCAGHADFVQTQTGEWWAVFLGCRPYEGDYYNTGRETFLAPVAWNEGWPIINPGKQTVQYRDAAPRSLPKDSARIPHSGNFVCRDEFETGVLSIDWQFLRTPHERWYDLSSHAGFLAMQLRPEACTGTSNPSFLGFRQAHATGSASTALSFSPAAENEKAGLLIFQNERRFYWLCKSIKGSTPVLELFAGSDSSNGYDHMQLLASTELMNMQRGQPVYLKIEAHGNTYAFLYAMQPGQWNILQDNVDATSLSTKGAGGFVGCLYGLYASSLGKSATTTAWYDWFEYRGDDQVYR
jgi:alpha-N-arabinofuranosidase